MSRYFIRPKSWSQDLPEKVEPTPASAMTVFPDEDRNTGLVDMDGNQIMARPNPIGFLAEIDE